MKSDNRFTAILLMALALGSGVGCGKQEETARPSQTVNPGESWQKAMPAKFAGLTVKDGGACYLDDVNGAPIGDAPIVVKSGSPVSLAGWAVVDPKAGQLGGGGGIQLNAPAPYFIGAARYIRPGLGAAIKGDSSLDGGGLKLDFTPLSIPAGDYRILFLIQSDANLFRCDTGRTLRVQ